jgi:hypothetical protein
MKRFHVHVAGEDLATQAEKDIACCSARSNKHWVADPTGIAWETFHTLGAAPAANDEPAAARAGSACRSPQPASIEPKAARVSCCG